MSNESKMLYVGVTDDLQKRVFQHKSKLIPGFTQKYNLHKLVCFEVFADIRVAIAREKQIKGWLRSKKVLLINSKNPQWKDLAEAHFKSAERFKSSLASLFNNLKHPLNNHIAQNRVILRLSDEDSRRTSA